MRLPRIERSTGIPQDSMHSNRTIDGDSIRLVSIGARLWLDRLESDDRGSHHDHHHYLHHHHHHHHHHHQHHHHDHHHRSTILARIRAAGLMSLRRRSAAAVTSSKQKSSLACSVAMLSEPGCGDRQAAALRYSDAFSITTSVKSAMSSRVLRFVLVWGFVSLTP